MHASKLSYCKLFALLAMMVSAVAFFVDGMLPTLHQVATDLNPEAPKRAQEILVWFMFCMGIANLLWEQFQTPFPDKK